jgi:hypothetical protein
MQSNLFRRILPVLCVAVLASTFLPSSSEAQVAVGVSVNFAPPVLPVYVQPPIPEPGYLWTPGYWAWGPFGYYWVPGTWVAPPVVGFLWTPGYWGWAGGSYFWHAGYWGPHIGFYGGVDYGFGYTGHGYWGGEWRGGTFVYNREVTNVTNVNVTNVYTRTVINEGAPTRVSFNGGPGGIAARPSSVELAAAHEHHVAFTPMQRQHIQLAARNPTLRASFNGGRPAIAATGRAGVFSGRGVVAARAAGGAPHSVPERNFGGNRPGTPNFNAHHGNAGVYRPEAGSRALAPHAPQPKAYSQQRPEAHGAPQPHAAPRGGREPPHNEKGQERER